jgi:alcohol dehydrogenase YqhD (iron-dependent ADH family)
MQSFTVANPTPVHYGPKCVAQLGAAVAAAGFSQPLIIMGGGSARRNGALPDTLASLAAAGIADVPVCEGVRANPEISFVRKAMAEFKAHGCDCLIAVGGGSVIDTTKGVAAGLLYPGDVWELYETRGFQIKATVPLFAVLTISATGSERNNGGVVQNDDLVRKYFIKHASLFPKASFVDPTYQMSLPWAQTVNGATDAMVHILEGCLNSRDGTEEVVTLGQNESYVRSIIEVTDRLLANADDLTARTNLCLAATLALDGQSDIGLGGGHWTCHMLEHGLSAAKPSVPHGAGLGVLMPAVMKRVAERDADGHAIVLRLLSNIFGAKTVDEGLDAWRATMRRWSAPTSLRAFGFESMADLEPCLKSAIEGHLAGGIRPATPEDARAIYEMSL